MRVLQKGPAGLVLVFICLMASQLLAGPVVVNLCLIEGSAPAESTELASRLIDSGIVIPLPTSDTPGRGKGIELPLDVPAKLKTTLRLNRARIANAVYTSLEPDRPRDVMLIDSGLRTEVTLLHLEGGEATFRVRFVESGKLLSEARVVVSLGSRAVVGAVGGAKIPYLFLVLKAERSGLLPELSTEPVLVEMVMPRYSAEAKKQGLEGRVQVRGVIEPGGTTDQLEVVSAPSPLLGKSALEAISLWRYLPMPEQAAVRTWTVAFRLE